MEADLDSIRQEKRPDILTEVASRFTIEHVLYLLILIVAAIMRLGDLDFVPLSPGEASEAAAVWNFWQPGPVDLSFSSPAYFSLTVLVTQVGGFSDTVMRLVPALLGMALVLLPWTIRHKTGQIGALIASLLLALSPALTHISRTASGQSIAVISGFLLFVAWLRIQEDGSRRWLLISGAVFALGLTSDPLFLGISLSLIAAWVIQYLVGPHILLDDEGNRRFWNRPVNGLVSNGLVLFIVLLVLLATTFLMVPQGIGVAADLFASWLGRFFNLAETSSIIAPFTAISRIEFVLLVLGIPALIWAAKKEAPFPIFLGYWISCGLLLMLLQPGSIDNFSILVLPGYLLIGTYADSIFRRFSGWPDTIVFLVILLAGSIALTNFIRFGRITSFQLASIGSYNLLVAITAIVLGAIAATLIWSWSETEISTGLLAGITVILLLVMWSDAWWLSHAGGGDTREKVIGTATDDSLRLLAGNLEDISWQLTNSKGDLEIVSTVDSPSLRWYLRDMDNLAFVSTVAGAESSEAFITPLGDMPSLADQYVGTEYAILRSDTPLQLEWHQVLGWRLFRETQTPILKQRVILWLRSDLAGETL